MFISLGFLLVNFDNLIVCMERHANAARRVLKTVP